MYSGGDITIGPRTNWTPVNAYNYHLGVCVNLPSSSCSTTRYEEVVIPAKAGIQSVLTKTGCPIKTFGHDNHTSEIASAREGSSDWQPIPMIWLGKTFGIDIGEAVSVAEQKVSALNKILERLPPDDTQAIEARGLLTKAQSELDEWQKVAVAAKETARRDLDATNAARAYERLTDCTTEAHRASREAPTLEEIADMKARLLPVPKPIPPSPLPSPPRGEGIETPPPAVERRAGGDVPVERMRKTPDGSVLLRRATDIELMGDGSGVVREAIPRQGEEVTRPVSQKELQPHIDKSSTSGVTEVVAKEEPTVLDGRVELAKGLTPKPPLGRRIKDAVDAADHCIEMFVEKIPKPVRLCGRVVKRAALPVAVVVTIYEAADMGLVLGDKRPTAGEKVSKSAEFGWAVIFLGGMIFAGKVVCASTVVCGVAVVGGIGIGYGINRATTHIKKKRVIRVSEGLYSVMGDLFSAVNTSLYASALARAEALNKNLLHEAVVNTLDHLLATRTDIMSNSGFWERAGLKPIFARMFDVLKEKLWLNSHYIMWLLFLAPHTGREADMVYVLGKANKKAVSYYNSMAGALGLTPVGRFSDGSFKFIKASGQEEGAMPQPEEVPPPPPRVDTSPAKKKPPVRRKPTVKPAKVEKKEAEDEGDIGFTD